jgi:predicted porin
VAATYVNGPLGIGAGYEKHENFGALGGASDFDDKGYGVTASYTFGKNIQVGGGWLRRKFENPGGDLKKDTYVIGVEWAIAGPHEIHAQYAYARDTKGDSGATRIAARGGIETPGNNTGGDQWSIAYQYNFSKRTSIKFGYTQIDNDSDTNLYYLGNAPRPEFGTKQDDFAFLIKHNF